MVALIAVARKILTILNAMLRDKNHGSPLDTNTVAEEAKGWGGPDLTLTRGQH